MFESALPGEECPPRYSPIPPGKRASGGIRSLLPGPRCAFLVRMRPQQGRVDVTDHLVGRAPSPKARSRAFARAPRIASSSLPGSAPPTRSSNSERSPYAGTASATRKPCSSNGAAAPTASAWCLATQAGIDLLRAAALELIAALFNEQGNSEAATAFQLAPHLLAEGCGIKLPRRARTPGTPRG